MSAEPVPKPLAAIRRVRVGSQNGPKIEAVRSALAPYAPGVEVCGAEVGSGVPAQPVGFEEIVRGARNRAAAAFEGGDCDLGVGIEDGLVALPPGAASAPHEHVNIGCAAVSDGRRVSVGFSSAFAYPPAVSRPAVLHREPIGALFDRLWDERIDPSGRPAPARGAGNVGKLTAGVLPRSEYARHAVLCALVAFVNPDLYPDSEEGR